MPFEKTRQLMPSPDILLYSENLKDFFYWMYERQNIWYNRFVLKKKRPWTENKILDEYKFTNVYRELDRNTVWLIQNIIKQKTDPKNMLWKIIVFRYFNKPELFDFMDGIPDLRNYNEKKFNKKVIQYKEKFGRVFTDAYLIHPPRTVEDRELGIELFYCKHIRDVHRLMHKFIWKGYDESKKPKDFIKVLKKLYSIADFIAYEIYCDCCYTKWFKWNENDYVNVGPGAKFGLELIFPRVYKEKNYNYLLQYLKDTSDFWFNKFGYNMKYYNRHNPSDYKSQFAKKMTLRTIEHSLCEYSKYWKMKLNAGKPRQKFIQKTF